MVCCSGQIVSQPWLVIQNVTGSLGSTLQFYVDYARAEVRWFPWVVPMGGMVPVPWVVVVGCLCPGCGQGSRFISLLQGCGLGVLWLDLFTLVSILVCILGALFVGFDCVDGSVSG